MSSFPETARFPFPPSPVPYDLAPEMRGLNAKCPVTQLLAAGHESTANSINLAFGAGARHCPGAQLARMELQEAFRGLLTRLPGLRMMTPMSELEFREGQAITSMREAPGHPRRHMTGGDA